MDGLPRDAFVVYQGSHGDAGAHRADVILPGVTYAEKSGTYVNMDGRIQRTKPAISPVGYSRQDWQIIRALSEISNATLPYNTLQEIRERMAEISPSFAKVDEISVPSFQCPVDTQTITIPSGAPFEHHIDNFFQTCPITRNSRVMARATQELPISRNSFVNA